MTSISHRINSLHGCLNGLRTHLENLTDEHRPDATLTEAIHDRIDELETLVDQLASSARPPVKPGQCEAWYRAEGGACQNPATHVVTDDQGRTAKLCRLCASPEQLRQRPDFDRLRVRTLHTEAA